MAMRQIELFPSTAAAPAAPSAASADVELAGLRAKKAEIDARGGAPAPTLTLPSLVDARRAAAAAATRPPLVRDELLTPDARAVARRLERLFLPDDRSWLELAGECARTEGVRLEDVLTVSRTKAVSRARQRTWHELKALTTASSVEIAEAFGRHHATVLDGIRAHAERLAAPPAARFLELRPARARARDDATPDANALADALAARTLPDGRTWLVVAEASCAAEGADLEALLAGRRTRAVVAARHRAWCELRSSAPYSYAEIGVVWGCPHETVLQGVKTHEARIAAAVIARRAG
jgi:hypothetical protein